MANNNIGNHGAQAIFSKLKDGTSVTDIVYVAC
jgi:hypothetical protein